MKRRQIAFYLLSASVLAGCGASSNSAPVVYGTEPATVGRVYNSPADIYLNKEQPKQSVAAYSANDYRSNPNAVRSTPNSQPAPLTPVAQNAYQAPVYNDPIYQAAAAAQNTSYRGGRPQPVLVAETQPVVSPPTDWPASATRYVTVQPGDTVYAIARRTGAHPKAIIAENNLRAPYSLRVGQALMVPGRGQKVSNAIAQPVAAPTSAVRRVTDGSSVVHIIQPGDTLYSISRRSGYSVASIAQANGLRPPYQLSIGDRIRLPGPSQQVASAPARKAAPAYQPQASVADVAREVSYTKPAPVMPKEPAAMFQWPVKGAIIGAYGAGDLGRRNDGINIAAPVGTPVRASADGEVVYRGSEVDGYGNLLLIKHDNNYVTAYAHNDVVLVRKGQRVRQGQIIAKVGQSGAAPEPQLHFEIRQNLKSVDPVALLN